MKLLAWLHRSKPVAPASKTLRCDNCHAAIHRGDHYSIIAVRHLDCTDRQQMRKKSLGFEERT